MSNNDITTSNYHMCVNFGGWVIYRKAAIHAENDSDAIAEADEVYYESETLQNWQGGAALFCGDRLVKEYDYQP